MTKIQILGTGCSKCKALTANAEQAAREAGIAYEIVKVTDINEIVEFGVMTTPALVIDGQVKAAGRIPSPEQIRAMLGGQGASS